MEAVKNLAPKHGDKHDVKPLEGRVKELREGLAKLSEAKDCDEFLALIRKPGWTTVAETALVSGILDGMVAQIKVLAGLKQALMVGSLEVGVKG